MRLASLDMYRKVPLDLVESTRQGSLCSIFALCVMVFLFVMETREFLTLTPVTDLQIDSNQEPRLRMNFNITMFDLPCDHTEIEVVSTFLGGAEQTHAVHKNVHKFHLGQDKVRAAFYGRNKAQQDILFHDETVQETIEQLHVNGQDATNLDPVTLEFAKRENTFLFVDFFAPWCSHCQVLAPTWETLAELMNDAALVHVLDRAGTMRDMVNDHISEEELQEAAKLHKPVEVAKVDCVEHMDLCRTNQIYAYPTLRLYVNGEMHSNYNGDRTLVEFTNYLAAVEQDFEQQHPEKDKGRVEKVDEMAVERHDGILGTKKQASKDVRRQKREWKDEEHPGCQISGFLLLDRVPGNFHIKAKSNAHDLVPSMTNVSHEVHDLSFGEQALTNLIRNRNTAAPDGVYEKMHPMKDYVYVTPELHTSFQHHLKVVTTEYEYVNYMSRPSIGKSYQVLTQSQLSYYEEDVVPEAKFVYDLSPIMIRYRRSSRKWYDYLTSVMAIVGGTFTVVGMVEASMRSAKRTLHKLK